MVTQSRESLRSDLAYAIVCYMTMRLLLKCSDEDGMKMNRVERER